MPESYVVIEGFGGYTGSKLYPHEGGVPANDLDFFYKCKNELLNMSGLALKVERSAKQVDEKITRLSHLAVPEGPSWSYATGYDLVMIKRKELDFVLVREDFARFIKQQTKLETDPKRIRPGVPYEVYKAGGEFALRDTEDILDWAQKHFDAGKRIVTQPKADGYRIESHLWNDGKRFAAFTEGGRDRSALLEPFGDWLRANLKDDSILDHEFIPLRDGKIIPRQEGIALIVGKEMPDDLGFLILPHDSVWWNGPIHDEPYLEGRWTAVEETIPEKKTKINGNLWIQRMPSFVAENKEELRNLITSVGKMLSAEGVMLKAEDFTYDFGKSVPDVAKVKAITEVSISVIGWRKVPKGRPAGVRWTREEAMKALPKQLKESNTYVLRGAIIGPDGKPMAIESEVKLTPKELEWDWDEERQEWTGTQDPKYWTMCEGFPHRVKGERAYGVTFALRWDPPGPKCGNIVDIGPAAVQVLEDPKGLSWTFPRVRNIAPEKDEPGKYNSILDAFRRRRPAIAAQTREELERGAVYKYMHRRDKCMRCKKSKPEIEVIWANGHGHVWFCKICYRKWKAESERHKVDREREVPNGIVPVRWKDGPVGVAKGIRQAFGASGGKKKQLAKLITRILPKHKTYVEPFASGAAVYFAKDPSDIEVLNDKNREIIFAYRFLKKCTERDIARLRRMKTEYNRAHWFKLRDASIPSEEVARFHRFLYVRLFSFGYNETSTIGEGSDFGGRNLNNLYNRIPRIKERLKNTKLRNQDWRKIIKDFDSPDTIFYCDPPYPEQQANQKTDLTEEEIFSVLRRIKGKFLLSLNNSKTVRELGKGLHIRRVQVRRTLENREGRAHVDSEVLISNYDLPKRLKKYEVELCSL